MDTALPRGYELVERQPYGGGPVDLARHTAALLAIARADDPAGACLAATRGCAHLSDSGRAAVAVRETSLTWHLVAGQNIADLPEYITASADADPFSFRAGEIVRIRDVAEYAQVHPQAHAVAAAGIHNLIAGALQLGLQDGYLAVYNEAAREYSSDEVTLLAVIALQLSLALTRSAEAQLLQRAAEVVPQLVWLATADGSADYANKRWCDYTGLSIEATRDAGWHEVLHPEDRQRCVQAWHEALARGEEFEIEYRLRRASDQAFRWFLGRGLPLKDASGAVVKWFGTCTDIDDQKRVSDSMGFLLEVSEIIASTAEMPATLQRIAELAIPRVSDWCIIYLTNNRGALYQAAIAHDDPDALAAASDILERYPIVESGQVRQAFQANAPLLIPDINEAVLRRNVVDVQQLEMVGKLRARSAMLLPLRARDRSYGALVFISGKSGRVFGTPDLTLAQLVAKRVAVAVDNARLFEQERQSALRLQFLADATKALTASLDVRTTLDTLMDLIVPRVADWASINLLEEDGSYRISAFKHRAPELEEVAAGLRGARVARPGATMGTAAAIRTGKTEVYQHLNADSIVKMVGKDMLPSIERLGYDSMTVIPLRSRGRILGSLVAAWIGYKRGRTIDLNDVPVLEELAARAASAIEHAQSYERQHHVAHTLQQAFLPATFPHLPGVQFDAVYASGHSEAEIGGDWYDAFELFDGRIFISVGDVAGRGLPAAVTMGKMRQALRSFALDHTDLGALLASANSALRLENPDTMVTVFVGIIDRDAQTIAYAIAGHPRPFMRFADGSIAELGGEGIPLGIRTNFKVSSQSAPFPLDAMLVCYTDGLTENTHDVFEGENRLRAALADDSIASAERPAEALMHAVVPNDHHDDVALLTVSMRRTFPGSLNFSLPAVATSAHKVRNAIRAYARDLNVSDEKDFEIQVAVGEAVNNVIEHAYGAGEGDVWVTAQSTDGKLVVEVSDRGSWRMPRRDHGGRGLRIIEHLCESIVVHSGKDRSFVRLVFDLSSDG